MKSRTAIMSVFEHAQTATKHQVYCLIFQKKTITKYLVNIFAESARFVCPSWLKLCTFDSTCCCAMNSSKSLWTECAEKEAGVACVIRLVTTRPTLFAVISSSNSNTNSSSSSNKQQQQQQHSNSNNTSSNDCSDNDTNNQRYGANLFSFFSSLPLLAECHRELR